MVVAIPLKIWNASRIEIKLKEQKRLVLEARFDALQRQINPHFLFNTLNSIASLVRFRPEMAREMIVQLGNILRALLKDHDAYVPFREELTFTDDYLGIEVVRFGAEKLRVVKEIDPTTLELLVPCMLLQPLIENSIKHGLEPRLQGGTITLRSRIQGAKMIVEVEDDGVGMAEGRAREVGFVSRGAGIGMRNVRERLEVLYGNSCPLRSVQPSGAGNARHPGDPHGAQRPGAGRSDLSARQHRLVVLLVNGNDARGTIVVLGGSPAASPIAARRASSVSNSMAPAAMASTSPTAKSRPVTPSSINSGTPPHGWRWWEPCRPWLRAPPAQTTPVRWA